MNNLQQKVGLKNEIHYHLSVLSTELWRALPLRSIGKSKVTHSLEINFWNNSHLSFFHTCITLADNFGWQLWLARTLAHYKLVIHSEYSHNNVTMKWCMKINCCHVAKLQSFKKLTITRVVQLHDSQINSPFWLNCALKFCSNKKAASELINWIAFIGYNLRNDFIMQLTNEK